MRILVTGGAGFIGSHLCDALLGRGDTVVAVDNLATGRRENLAHLDGHTRFTFVEHDIVRPLDEAGPPWPAGEPFAAVLHLASPASPEDFATMPLEILAAGSTGTSNMLELARRHRARFLLASTSEVYGDPLEHPQTESYWGNVDPIGPRSCYDEAKRFSEALTMAHHRVHGTEIRIARIFNTYGERMRIDDGRVITNFCGQAFAGRPITLYGDGSRTRSFCHVSDLVDGLVRLLDGPVAGPVNLGNPTELTMRELAELVVELTGSTSEIVSVPLPPERAGDPAQRRPDITLAETVLGWRPSVAIRDGLTRMVAALRAEPAVG